MNAKCHMHSMKKYFYLGDPSSFDYVCMYLGLLRFSKHIGLVWHIMNFKKIIWRDVIELT